MNIDIKINEVYDDLLDNETPRQLIFGGSSSGKSVFLAQRAILDILHNKRNYLIVRNVAKTIRQSTFNELSKLINDMDLNSVITVNKTDMVFTTKAGYQILSCGLDDPQKLKSITPAKGVITDIWIEEGTEIDYNSYKELTKRLRGASGHLGKKRITISFNPILKSSWIYSEFFGNWDESKTKYSDDEVYILKTTYKDNKFLTLDDIAALENEKDPYYYNVYTLGNWGVLGSVIFKNWRVENIKEMLAADGTPLWLTFDNYKNGLDFGFASDPAALPRSHYDSKRKRIYLLDEIYQRGLTNDLLAHEIKNMIGYEYVYCDSAEPKSIQELKNLGISALSAKKGKDSVLHGIQWLQQQEIIIDVSCQNAKNEFQTYQWKEDQSGNALPIPVDKNNHLIDALRYAYADEMKNRMEPITVRM